MWRFSLRSTLKEGLISFRQNIWKILVIGFTDWVSATLPKCVSWQVFVKVFTQICCYLSKLLGSFDCESSCTEMAKLNVISNCTIYQNLQFTCYAAEAYSETFQTSKAEVFGKKINGFQLLTSLAKSFTSDVLQGSENASFQFTINIEKPCMTKTNHRTTLRQVK